MVDLVLEKTRFMVQDRDAASQLSFDVSNFGLKKLLKLLKIYKNHNF